MSASGSYNEPSIPAIIHHGGGASPGPQSHADARMPNSSWPTAAEPRGSSQPVMYTGRATVGRKKSSEPMHLMVEEREQNSQESVYNSRSEESIAAQTKRINKKKRSVSTGTVFGEK